MSARKFLRFHHLLLTLLLLLTGGSSHADNLLMVRVHQPLNATLNHLRNVIHEQGYKVTRVDLVNIGLLGMGYTSNEYRAVFFGKADEIHRLTREYPELVPYLPLRIAVFAEGESTLLVTLNPVVYGDFLPDGKPGEIIRQWRKDIETILSKMQHS